MAKQTVKPVSRLNSVEAVIKKQIVTERIDRNTAALEKLRAAVNIQVGDTVTVKTGRRSPNNPETDTYKEVPMQVLDMAVIDGKQLYKVQEGEGFAAKQHTIDITKIVLDLPEDAGKLSEEQLLNRLESDRKYLQELEARHAAALEEENRALPYEAYTRLGRADTARTVAATIVAKHTDAHGVTKYAVIAEDELQLVNLNQLRNEAEEAEESADRADKAVEADVPAID
jgi:hypothetical protein